MKPRLSRALVCAALVGLALALCPSASMAGGPLYRTSRFSRMTHKLWRGLVNIPFCVAEIPIEINRETQNYDPFGGTVKGLAQGVYRTGERLLWAVADVVTFPIDVWGDNYGTKMRSEFPFVDETVE